MAMDTEAPATPHPAPDATPFKYVDEAGLPEDLKCSVCLEPFMDPVMHTQCRNVFCSTCLLYVSIFFLMPLPSRNQKRLMNFIFSVGSLILLPSPYAHPSRHSILLIKLVR
jgi:hypothetical protein